MIAERAPRNYPVVDAAKLHGPVLNWGARVQRRPVAPVHESRYAANAVGALSKNAVLAADRGFAVRTLPLANRQCPSLRVPVFSCVGPRPRLGIFQKSPIGN